MVLYFHRKGKPLTLLLFPLWPLQRQSLGEERYFSGGLKMLPRKVTNSSLIMQ